MEKANPALELSNGGIEEAAGHGSPTQRAAGLSWRLRAVAALLTVALAISVGFTMHRGVISSPDQTAKPVESSIERAMEELLTEEKVPRRPSPPLEVLRRPSVIPKGQPEYLDQLLPEHGPLSVDDESIALCRKELDAAARSLFAYWDQCSDTVKRSYNTHFGPQRREAQPPSLDENIDHVVADAVNAYNEVLPEDLATTEGRQAVVARMLISMTVIRAILTRLTLLKELEEFCQETGASAVVLNLPQAPLPSAEALAQLPQDTSFEDFVIMSGRSAIVEKKNVPALSQRVPKILARRLAASVIADDMLLESHRYVHGLFTWLINRLATKDLLIKEALDEVFPPLLCRRVLKAFEKLRETELVDARTLGVWAEDWSVQGVLDRLQLNEEEAQARHERWLDMRSYGTPEHIYYQAISLF
ncbi:hypothetical protein Efla_005329 [Eimeria flavescens]